MKKIKMILGIVFLFSVIIGNASNVKTEIIYFDVAKANIKESQKQKIEKISKANQIYLVGHTDSDGNIDYNKSLSKSRVKSVFNFLLENGLSKEKINFEYFGEEKPLNKNTNETQKADNRRVEIRYIIDPLMDFEVEKQMFDINNDSETVIKGKDGTEILIPANTFDAKNVKLELKEFYSTLDILSSNLSTQSNGELLETSGMIYLEATSEGKKVKPNNDFTIKFKKMSDKKGFQLFEGNITKKDLDMNWNTIGGKSNIIDKEIVYDIYERQMSDFAVHDQLGRLLNEGKYSWYSKNNKSQFHNVSAAWKNWEQFFDYTDFYDNETHQCFENVSLELDIDSMGKVETIKTNFKDKTHYCEKFYRRILTDNIIADGLKGSSFLSINFEMDFTEIDSISAFINIENERLKIEWQAKIDSINSFNKVQKKTQERIEKAFYTTNSIITQSAKLGWINCDRFIQKVPKTDFIVTISEDMNVRMIVKSFNSFYNGHSDYTLDNKQVFTKIPLGQKVTLICTAYKEDKILLAIEETTITKKEFSDFHFSVVTKEELKNKIESL